MNEVLRDRLWRQLEALPEAQLYQALDYLEFLASKYARDSLRPPGSALQRFGERLEDQLRVNRVGYDAIRNTMNVVGAADRMVSGLAEAGRTILREVATPPGQGGAGVSSGPSGPPLTEGAPRKPGIIVDG